MFLILHLLLFFIFLFTFTFALFSGGTCGLLISFSNSFEYIGEPFIGNTEALL